MGLDLTSKIIGVNGSTAEVLSKGEANAWKEFIDDAEEFALYNYDTKTIEKIVDDSSESYYDEAAKEIKSKPCKIRYNVFDRSVFTSLQNQFEHNLQEYKDDLELNKEAFYKSTTIEIHNECLEEINSIKESIKYVEENLETLKYLLSAFDYITNDSMPLDKYEPTSYENYYLIMEYYD